MLQACISQGTIHPSTADCMHPSAHAGKGPHFTHLLAVGRAVLCPRTRRRCGSASEPGGQPGPSATLQAGGGKVGTRTNISTMWLLLMLFAWMAHGGAIQVKSMGRRHSHATTMQHHATVQTWAGVAFLYPLAAGSLCSSLSPDALARCRNSAALHSAACGLFRAALGAALSLGLGLWRGLDAGHGGCPRVARRAWGSIARSVEARGRLGRGAMQAARGLLEKGRRRDVRLILRCMEIRECVSFDTDASG